MSHIGCDGTLCRCSEGEGEKGKEEQESFFFSAASDVSLSLQAAGMIKGTENRNTATLLIIL